MSEMKLVRSIVQAIKLRYPDVIVLRINSGAIVIGRDKKRRMFRGAPAGTSDLLLCVDGLFCAMEVKTKKGRLTPAQMEFLRRVDEEGGMVSVVRSVDSALEMVSAWRDS